ncbi:MAG: hypothetical protein JO034_20460 [Singulisphaera sp.]|nr:hypothetical protein [Singulisphaera sp.]
MATMSANELKAHLQRVLQAADRLFLALEEIKAAGYHLGSTGAVCLYRTSRVGGGGRRKGVRPPRSDAAPP